MTSISYQIGTRCAKSTTVTVNTAPSTPILSVINSCTSSVLSASGIAPGATVTWSDGFVGNPHSVTSAGTYSAIQTVGSCSSSSSTSILAAPTAPIPVLSANNISCYGGNDGKINVAPMSGVSGFSFQRTTSFKHLNCTAA